MTTRYQSLYPVVQFVDKRGKPLASGSLEVYLNGTTDLATVYSDSGLTTELTNPITLDSYGSTKMYVPFNIAYRLVAKDSNGEIKYSSGLLGNIDWSEIDTSSSVGTSSGGIRTITVSSGDVYCQTITTATDTNLTISPGAGGYTTIYNSYMTVTDSFKTSTNSFISNTYSAPYFS